VPILDRIPSRPDPVRLTTFAMTPLVQNLDPRSYTWRVPFTLNQGEEGACVAHGITHEAIARPVPVDFARHQLPLWGARAGFALLNSGASDEIAQAFAFDLYDWCRRNDEWAGENYDGTSAAAGAKGAVEAGLWGEYRWTRSVREFAVWVSRNGPGVIAVDWYSGMMRPDADGYLNLTGRVEGGHLLLANGYSRSRDAHRVHNSWSDDWGENGEAWIRDADLQRLANDNGELLGPVRRLR
jgi:hypothetical protein